MHWLGPPVALCPTLCFLYHKNCEFSKTLLLNFPLVVAQNARVLVLGCFRLPPRTGWSFSISHCTCTSTKGGVVRHRNGLRGNFHAASVLKNHLMRWQMMHKKHYGLNKSTEVRQQSTLFRHAKCRMGLERLLGKKIPLPPLGVDSRFRYYMDGCIYLKASTRFPEEIALAVLDAEGIDIDAILADARGIEELLDRDVCDGISDGLKAYLKDLLAPQLRMIVSIFAELSAQDLLPWMDWLEADAPGKAYHLGEKINSVLHTLDELCAEDNDEVIDSYFEFVFAIVGICRSTASEGSTEAQCVRSVAGWSQLCVSI